MAKKIFAVLMAAILLIPCISFAKKKSAEIPMNERIKMVVYVTNATNFTELNASKILRDKIVSQLKAQEIFNILNPTEENSFADIKTLENKGSSDVGDLVIFPTKDIELQMDNYKNLGADYVIQCEILGLGFSTETDNNFGMGNGIGIGIGTGGGFGIGIGTGGSTLRTLYSTAINMQIVEVESGAVISRKNLFGQAFKHRKPKKGYDDATDEAYLKSLDDAAKIITKSIKTFAAKNFKQYKNIRA